MKKRADFIKNFADTHGLPQPPLCGRDSFPPVYLPPSMTYKSVHQQYVAVCQLEQTRSVAITLFNEIWHQCFPQIKFMTPRTDVCQKCEDFRSQVSHAVTEDEKRDALQHFNDHLQDAQTEREFYKKCTDDAIAEITAADVDTSDGPHAPCSRNITKAHYTFENVREHVAPAFQDITCPPPPPCPLPEPH